MILLSTRMGFFRWGREYNDEIFCPMTYATNGTETDSMKRILTLFLLLLAVSLGAAPASSTVSRSIMEVSNMIVAPQNFWPTQVFSVSFSNAVNAVVTNSGGGGSSTGGVAVVSGTNIIITTNGNLATINGTVGTNSLFWRSNFNNGITNTGGDVIVKSGTFQVGSGHVFFQDGTAALDNGNVTMGASSFNVRTNGAADVDTFLTDGSVFMGGGILSYKFWMDTLGGVTITNLAGTGNRFVQVNANGKLSPSLFAVTDAITNHDTRAISVSNTWVFGTPSSHTTIASGVIASSGAILGDTLLGNQIEDAWLVTNELVYSGAGGLLSNFTNGTTNMVLVSGGASSPPYFTNLNAVTSVGTNTFSAFTWQTNITELKWNIDGFGAAGDGKIATNVSMTSGSMAVTVVGGTFTTNDIGKVFSLYGAGSSGQNLTTLITNVAGVNSITVSNAAVATVSSNSAVYGSDDTAAIQAAMNYVATNGGGTILFPSGIYIVNGPLLDTGTNRLHHNAQLYFPDVPQRGNLAPTIKFEGVLPLPWFIGLGAVRSNEFSSYGSCIWSTLASGPDVNPGRVIDCRNFNTPNARGFCNDSMDNLSLNNLDVSVKNIIWRAAFDNNLALLDLQGSDGCTIEETIIDNGWYQGFSPPMTHTNTWGLKTSGSFNANMSYANNILVRAFYWGIDVGENSTIPNLHVEGCVNAICNSGLSGTAGKWIGHANVQESSNVLAFGPCAVNLQIDKLDVYSYLNFTNTINLIFDPNNAWYGGVTYAFGGAKTEYQTQAGGGLPVVGGSNVKIKRLGTSFFPEEHETAIVANASDSMYFRKLWGYGDGQGSQIGWGTNAVGFATTAEWKAYVSGSQNSWNLEHTRAGTTPLSFDGLDNVIIGVSGKTFQAPSMSGTGNRLLQADASGFVTATATVNAGTNIDNYYRSFPSATNTLTLNNGYWLLNTSTDCSVTNIVGQVANKVMWSTLAVSNASASAINFRMTGGLSIRPQGLQTTNNVVLASGKMAVFSAISFGTLNTNYCNTSQQ
jgi:hypothetical protein